MLQGNGSIGNNNYNRRGRGRGSGRGIGVSNVRRLLSLDCAAFKEL